MPKGVYPKSVQPGIPRLKKTPNGWSKCRFRDVLKEVERPIKMNPDSFYELVTVRRSRGGVVSRESLKGKQILTKTQKLIEAGDFLISKRQIVHGACGVVPESLNGAIVSNEYATLNTIDGLNMEYLKHFSHSIYFQQACFHSSVGVHVEKMIFKTERWLDWEFSLPPLPEQARIASILSTWDEAIDQTEKLIDAKTRLNKGLMQRLLVGKKRIPGQTNATHKEYRIGDLLEEVKRDIVFDDDEQYELISVRRRSGGLFHRESLHGRDILTKGLKDAKAGDFLVSKMQVVHGASGLVTREFDGMKISGSYIALVPRDKKKLNIRFFNYLSQIPFMYHLAYLASHGVHIEKMTFNLKLWLRSKVAIPKDIKEQVRIVSVLDSINSEIQSLRNYLLLLKSQKRGLMQVLLTGGVRVKVSQDRRSTK